MKKIIGIAIIIALLISGAYLLIQNQKLGKNIISLNNRIVDLEKQKNVKQDFTLDKIPDDWKEYTDNEYKFKIWYPEKIDQNILMYTSDNDKYSIRSFFINNPLDRGDIPQAVMDIYIYI